MTLEQRQYMVEIISDLDARFPGSGSLTTEQIKQYFSVSYLTARQWMRDHGVRVGDPRMPKIALARFIACEKY